MADRSIIALAVAAWIVALEARPIGGRELSIAALFTAAAWLARRRGLAATVIVLVIIAWRADATWERLRAPLPSEHTGQAVVLTDPDSVGSSTRVVVDTTIGRVEILASGPQAASVVSLEVGEVVQITGTLRPWSGSTSRQASLHLRGRLNAAELEPVERAPAPWWRLANAARSAVSRGADSVPRTDRALYRGLVYGDDRGQPPGTAADFAAAGLTHLLAVSGQNVAFVLLAARPFLRSASFQTRWLLVVGVLGLFGAVTRFEPSVLRAVTMALVVATAELVGREVSALRAVSVTVIALLVADPLLVAAIGFQLSVGATVGIVVLSSRIAERLPGPEPVRVGLATTMGAQLGVAPLLVVVFGPVGLVSLPANLLAAPAAALLMTWGLTVGVLAGAVGGMVGRVLQLPATASLLWLRTVARVFADLPIGRVGLGMVVALVVLTTLWLWGRGVVARGAGGAIVAVLIVTAASGTRLHPGVHQLGVGATAYVDHRAVVVTLDGRADPRRAVTGLRDAGVRRVDVVVVSGASARAAATVGTLRRRLAIAVVIADPATRIPGATESEEGAWNVGRWLVCIDRDHRASVEAQPLGDAPVGCEP